MANVSGIDFSQKPKDFLEYRPWFCNKFSFNYDKYCNYYENAVKSLSGKCDESIFWKTLGKNISDIDAKYFKEKGVHLFSRDGMPKLCRKSLDSLFKKSFKKNILKNTNFPKEPDGGWINKDSWFEKIHDIVRTTFVVKYLDGVKVLTDEIKRVADECNVGFEYEYVAKNDGYYASHINIADTINLLQEDWSYKEIRFTIEIQITTELQETIKGLLHKNYEKNRIQPNEDYKWQWDYDSEQFKSNYLGHMAHYLEGMIVEIRDKQK